MKFIHIADVHWGMNPDSDKPWGVDRAQAIKTATMLAKRGDVILVAGKGHEDYQEVKGVKHHFEDREQLRKLFHQA